ncbi:L,D-transpeptidase family protein [Clostridium bowmanii]|uniref:L,D-transpeptidase family protein n=1 Tax=Clostridium bowmanii TaxID=132925 RepID=UPI001C0C581A|nr:L,D-transpeptidase family protein [Clostridium bowmanii]MBU3188863.1 L,D-transpeptidase family protein [Clostridium bowmanii]MCA1073731.1 L,D-transpeptidase family protein [Clostridium bowmanii]
MKKKDIVIGTLLAVGAIGAYEIYKNNFKAYNASFYEVDESDKQIIWTLAGENLFFTKPSTEPQEVVIKVYKGLRTLEVYGDDILIGRFKVALGGAVIGDKYKDGDKKTPEGKYYVCTRNEESKYTLFLGLSYPNIEDAKRGLQNGLIDDLAFKEIETQIENGKRPDWTTSLGGSVGIHGGGNQGDWTFGCMAVSDDDIRIIWDYAKMNTPVEIYE